MTGVAVLRRGRVTTAVDAKAKLMASPSELTGVTRNQGLTRARQLRPDLAMVKTLSDRDTGAVVGRTVRGREKLFMSWEDMLFAFAGPRMGKTVALAVDMFGASAGKHPRHGSRHETTAQMLYPVA